MYWLLCLDLDVLGCPVSLVRKVISVNLYQVSCVVLRGSLKIKTSTDSVQMLRSYSGMTVARATLEQTLTALISHFHVFWLRQSMGNDERGSPLTLFFSYKQKWVTAAKFGEKLAYWPIAALLFILFLSKIYENRSNISQKQVSKICKVEKCFKDFENRALRNLSSISLFKKSLKLVFIKYYCDFHRFGSKKV